MVRSLLKSLRNDGHKFYALFVHYEGNIYYLDDTSNIVYCYSMEDGTLMYKRIFSEGRGFFAKENLKNVPTLLVDIEDFSEDYHKDLIELFMSATSSSYTQVGVTRREITMSDEFEKSIHKEQYWGYSESNQLKR